MAEIPLCTLNARYIHPALGLRYLLAEEPRIIALGVCVWNATQMTHLVKILRAIAPEVHSSSLQTTGWSPRLALDRQGGA